MDARPLHEIAREIARTWPQPSPHAKAYLKAMHYLVGIEDTFAAGNARRIVRYFLLYSKEWQNEPAERIKTELRAIGQQAKVETVTLPMIAPASRTDAAPAACELCTLPIRDKYVHGRSVWGVTAQMCPACHYYIGVGFEQGDGALFHRTADGQWQLLHGTSPARDDAPAGTVEAKPHGLVARGIQNIMRLIR